jgi:hypothetical protein
MGTSEETVEQAATVENRRCPRLKCDITAECSTFRGRWSCRIVDIGERGMCIVSDATLQKGAVVNFIDPRTRAQVVWAEGNRAGLRIIN